MSGTRNPTERGSLSPDFRTTHWSLVLSAGQQEDAVSYEALSKLCSAYWKPVCHFVYRSCRDPERAKDLTQSFFARLLERPEILRSAKRDRGRFRAFLLTAVRNFVVNVREWEHATKRGGGMAFVPLEAHSLAFTEPADWQSPDKEFDRRCALALIERVMEQLKRKFVTAGRGEQFELLQEFLPGRRGTDLTYAAVAQRLNTTESAVRQSAHRLRLQFREVLRAEVAQTLASPEDLDDELQHLLTALGG